MLPIIQMHTKAVLTPCDNYLLATPNSLVTVPVVLVRILREQQRVPWCSDAVCWRRKNKGEAVSTNCAHRQETWYSSSRHGLNLEGGRLCACVWYQQQQTWSPAGHTLHRQVYCVHVCVCCLILYSTSEPWLIIPPNQSNLQNCVSAEFNLLSHALTLYLIWAPIATKIPI